MKSQFVSTISHEVRTPLAGVIGLTEFLTTLELLPEVREIVDHIGQASSNLFSILNNLVEFSRLEAEKAEIDYVVFEPRRIVSEIEASFEAELVRKKLPLRVEIADDVPIKIYGDERKTVQILSHLLSNAIKFTSVGNLTIQASLLEINNSSSKRVRFSVIDTGVGLTKEAQERIFQPFAQAAGPQMTFSDGVGVGLSVCKHYIDVLGGEIGCDSELGKGSTFWFNLPFLSESAEACQKNEES